MARAREDALVWREAARARAEVDEAAVLCGGEPDYAGATVRARRRVVGVDQTREGDALVRIGIGEAVGITEGRGCAVAPRIAGAEELVEQGTRAAIRGRKAAAGRGGKVGEDVVGGHGAAW